MFKRYNDNPSLFYLCVDRKSRNSNGFVGELKHFEIILVQLNSVFIVL